MRPMAPESDPFTEVTHLYLESLIGKQRSENVVILRLLIKHSWGKAQWSDVHQFALSPSYPFLDRPCRLQSSQGWMRMGFCKILCRNYTATTMLSWSNGLSWLSIGKESGGCVCVWVYRRGGGLVLKDICLKMPGICVCVCVQIRMGLVQETGNLQS